MDKYSGETITRFTIFGERCSGTNYLATLIKKNFGLECTWEFGWKHFFGDRECIQNLKKKPLDDVLFLVIVRNLPEWLCSFFRNPWHVHKSITNSFKNFISSEWICFDDDGKEIDRHIQNSEKRYKNIFELREIKCKFLIDVLPYLVENFCFRTYEHILENTEEYLLFIHNKFKLPFMVDICKEVNNYKGYIHDKKFEKKNYIINARDFCWILAFTNVDLEKTMGYNYSKETML